MNAASTSASTGLLDVRIEVERIIDPSAARRLAQLLFAGSTGMVVATSTGVPS
jgi:hypothetical protein